MSKEKVIKRTKRAYHASHAVAQKRIKKGLLIENKVNGDAYSAIGQCLDEVTAVVIQRCIELVGPRDDDLAQTESGWPTLTSPMALSCLMSLVSDDQHVNVVNFINDALDAYHDVNTK